MSNVPGWRTFQFAENDTLSFNLIIKQPQGFFPQWSVNSGAYGAGDTGLTTKYRVKFIVKATPSTSPGGYATFVNPSLVAGEDDGA